MYKKLLWLSALTACFVTVFFAILGFTKVNKSVEYLANHTCNNSDTLSITDNLQPTEPLQHETPQPRDTSINCPKEEKEVQPRQDCEHCPHCPKHNEQKTTSKKHALNCKQCLKEMADDSTEDNLIISQQLVEQQKHLPHFRNRQMHIWDYLSPLFATMPFNPNDNFDIKCKNAFTIEIIENRDENGWRFYINGQEFQPNINNNTADDLRDNTIENTPENIPDNTPVPLPELSENNPILPEQPEQSEQAQQPEQPEQNVTEEQNHEDSTLLPEQTPYM